ncbi:hypothetical protein V6238_13470 [Marinomonas arenicola]|uniref:hypothetical protein n=1 Tax=Marinomonas arenicola TaxID=569601 RepID=UPI00311DC75C
MKIVELREYKIRPGKADQWITWMRDELLPYQRSQGMRILSTNLYQDENGDEYFIWTREFDDEQQRQAAYADTYNDWWVNEVRPQVAQLIELDSIKVRQIKPLWL